MVREIQFNSIPDFIDIVGSIPSTWNAHSNGIWYRGIENEYFDLVPGAIWRGIDLEVENSMVSEFLLHYESLVEKKIDNNLELYILMQHYGLPTRLLDWTISPLVVLYFALSRENISPGRRVVWVMSCHDLNKITCGKSTTIVPCSDKDCITSKNLPSVLNTKVDPEFSEYPMAFKHPLTNLRIKAQKGCFTFHGTDNRSIHSFFESTNCNYMMKLVLQNDVSRFELLNKLYTLGFKEDDLFQDLASLSTRIVREHRPCFRK